MKFREFSKKSTCKWLTSRQKLTIFSQSSLASPSSVCLRVSALTLSLRRSILPPRLWCCAKYTCGVWQATQCVDRVSFKRVHAGQAHSALRGAGMGITPVLEGDGSPSVPVEPLRPSFVRTAPQTRHLLALLRFRKVHFPHGQLVSGLCGSAEDGVVSGVGVSSSKTLRRLGRRLEVEGGGESGLSGATSLRLLGTGILCGPGDSGSDGSGLGESGSRRGPEACSSGP